MHLVKIIYRKHKHNPSMVSPMSPHSPAKPVLHNKYTLRVKQRVYLIPIIWVVGNRGGAEGNIHLPRKHHHFISALQSHLFRRSIPKPVSRSFGSFLLLANIRSNLIIAETNKSQMKTLNHSVLPNNTLHEFPTSIHQWQWLGERDDTRQI